MCEADLGGKKKNHTDKNLQILNHMSNETLIWCCKRVENCVQEVDFKKPKLGSFGAGASRSTYCGKSGLFSMACCTWAKIRSGDDLSELKTQSNA